MNPEDERKAFWKALHTVDDRVTDLKARFEERDAMTLDMIREAVRDTMPRNVVSDEQVAFLNGLIEIQKIRLAFRRKIIESSAIWAVPLVILAVLAVFREYAIAHGMWRP